MYLSCQIWKNALHFDRLSENKMTLSKIISLTFSEKKIGIIDIAI